MALLETYQIGYQKSYLIAPIEVHNGTGYAEYVKVKKKENLRIVSSGFALDGLVKSVAGRGQNYYPTKCRNLLV